MKRLERIARKVMCCRQCRGLNIPQKTEAAPAYGNVKSPIMLVGQSNHAYNAETPDRQIPFTNSSVREHAGSILFPAIERTGLKFSDLFTTNVVKCHPPGNRRTSDAETLACRRWLCAEIALVRPKLIVCLGNFAGEALNVSTKYRVCKSTIDLVDHHDDKTYPFDFHGVLLPHPASFLYRRDEADEERQAAAIEQFNVYFEWLIGEFYHG